MPRPVIPTKACNPCLARPMLDCFVGFARSAMTAACIHDATTAATSGARTGTEISAKSWATEAAMRMLMNNLDPRRRRGAGGAGRLWRHRPGGARLGELRPDRRDAEAAGGRRDPARPVGQAGRRVPHPCRRAAGADRQFEPGAEMGDLGPFQRTRSQGADDVRPDDGRIAGSTSAPRASFRAPTRPSPRWAASIMAATSRAAGS